MRMHHLIDYLDTSAIEARFKRWANEVIRSDDDDGDVFFRATAEAARTIDYSSHMRGWLMEIANEFEHYDVGDIYTDLPEEDMKYYVEYGNDLFARGEFELPADKLAISFNYLGERLLILERLEDKVSFDAILYCYKENPNKKDDFIKLSGMSMNLTAKPAVGNMIHLSYDSAKDAMSGEEMSDDDSSRTARSTISFILLLGSMFNTNDFTINRVATADKLNKARVRRGKIPIADVSEVRVAVAS
jgi:hypothetical protein